MRFFIQFFGGPADDHWVLTFQPGASWLCHSYPGDETALYKYAWRVELTGVIILGAEFQP